MKAEAVCCKTQEQWNFVCKIYNYLHVKDQFYDNNRCDNLKTSVGNCISFNDSTKEGFCYKDYYTNLNYKIYSFEEWCKLTNNYLNKSEEYVEEDLSYLVELLQTINVK